MKYLSTRNNKLQKSFSEILFQGLSSDGGLFLPSIWPSIDIKILRQKSYQQVALNIIYPFVSKEDVLAFQRQYSELVNDGIMGPKTMAMMEKVGYFKK